MIARHQVYLIPGIFGFSALGGLEYFRQLHRTLEDAFARRGVRAEIIGVRTLPTASLRHRARALMRTAREHGADEPGRIVHFVGHSTGALDARLASSPGARLGLGDWTEAVLSNLATIASISGPHRGTPLANFFSTLYGKNLLYLITLIVIVGLWRRPIVMLGGVLGAISRVHSLLGLDETFLIQLTNQLLRDFDREAEDEVRAFLRSILEDQGVMLQLTPEGMDVFDAACLERPGVRHVSWATAAPAPTKVFRSLRLRHALTPLNKVLYSILWGLTSRAHKGFAYEAVTELPGVAGAPPLTGINERTSDGVVPTRSQVWGEFRGVARADHLDVLGHYLRGPFDEQDGADWFGSNAGFGRVEFDRLWEDVAGVLLEADGGARDHASRRSPRSSQKTP